jgi:ArsR family transcriptional regulator
MKNDIVTSNSPAESDESSRVAACCGAAGPRLAAPDAEALAAQLGAVADPVRLQVLSIIAGAPGGEVCACDFVGPIGKSQPTISHHLKVLSEAGLVAGDRRGRWIWYRLAPSGLGNVLDSLAAVTTDEHAEG